jgi:DNA mismatch repair ATPase MutS
VTRPFQVVAALGVLGLGAFGISRLVERRATVREIRALRDGIYESRIAADSCRFSLAVEEGRLQRFSDLVDTLHAEVRDFEALDPRGVPEERYDAYLERFHAYNDSVAEWEARAERLRAHESECHAIIEVHNALSDSLRRRVAEELPERGGDEG